MTSLDRTPRAFVQQTGSRKRGPLAWRAFVLAGLLRFEGEYGTYAWTRRGAEKKAERLLRRYQASRPGPRIEVHR